MDKLRKTISIAVILTLIALVLFLTIGQKPDEPDKPLPPIPTIPMGSPPLGEQNFELKEGWNMVSMPETISKHSINITYEDNSYTWQEAVDNLYIVDVVMSYNGTDYVEVNTLYKTRGYWMYALVEPILISNEQLIIYCGKLIIDNETYSNHIVCDTIYIAPEYFENTITCATITVNNMFDFYFMGDEL